jgi:hypothetical protein
LSLFALVLAACNSHPIDQRIHLSIVGTWQGETTGTVMSIYGDGRLVIENAPGVPAGTVITGTVERGFDEVRIVYLAPASLCQGQSGVYRLSLKKSILTMEVLSEECPARAAQMDKTWKLLNMTPRPYGGK